LCFHLLYLKYGSKLLWRRARMNEGGAEGVLREGQVRVGTASFRRVNLALFCAGFITFVTLYDVQPLLPLFAREFSVSPAVASLPLSVATIALAVGMLIAGTVSESLGRRQVMIVALLRDDRQHGARVRRDLRHLPD
jgi:hypothetical protein